MSERISMVVTALGGRRIVQGQWVIPHPRTRAFEEASAEIGRAVMVALYDPGVLAVEVVPTAVARRAVPTGPIDSAQVIRATASECELQEVELYRGSDRRHVHGRWLAMTLIRSLVGLSYPAIGEVFGRDHSTVMYGVSKVQRWVLDGRADIQGRLARIESQIRGTLLPEPATEPVAVRVRAL